MHYAFIARNFAHMNQDIFVRNLECHLFYHNYHILYPEE